MLKAPVAVNLSCVALTRLNLLPQITPIKSSELDAVLAENKRELSRLTLGGSSYGGDEDLEGETRDLFVTIDNPEKHTTAMESYMTFRITTKVSTTTVRTSFQTNHKRVLAQNACVCVWGGGMLICVTLRQ